MTKKQREDKIELLAVKLKELETEDKASPKTQKQFEDQLARILRNVLDSPAQTKTRRSSRDPLYNK